MAFLPVRPHCANARWKGCQDLKRFAFAELEETTRTPSYYVDEDYPASPEIEEPLPEWEWSNWRGSKSSTLKTDVYVWHYALLVVHTIQDKEGENTYSDDRRLSIVCWPTTTVYILCTVTSEHEQLMTSVCLERQLSPTLALARLTAATTHTMTVYFNTRQCKLYTLVLYTLSQTSSIILARS